MPDTPSGTTSRKALAIVFITVVIDLLGFGMVLPLVPRYASTLQASGLVIGLLMSSFSAMQFLFAPRWGALSDRIGRRPVILIGLTGSVIFYGLFGVASALGTHEKLLGQGALFWMFISRIGAGIAGGTISTSQAYIADVTDRTQRSRGMALIGAAFGVGFTFGPCLGALTVWRAPEGTLPPFPGYAASALSAAALLWAWFSLPESLPAGAKPELRERSHLRQLAHLGAALRHPVIGLTLLASFLSIFSFAQFETTLSLLTKSLGMDVGLNYLIFAYIGLVLTISQGGLVRRLAPQLGERRMALLGVSLLIVGLSLVGVTAWLKSFWMLMGVVPLAVIGVSFTNPAFQSLLSLNAPADRQGEILGVGQSAAALARICGPLVGLSLQEQGESLPYWGAAAVMCIAWLMTWTLGKRLSLPQTSAP